jgi:hypothetical protein
MDFFNEILKNNFYYQSDELLTLVLFLAGFLSIVIFLELIFISSMFCALIVSVTS